MYVLKQETVQLYKDAEQNEQDTRDLVKEEERRRRLGRKKEEALLLIFSQFFSSLKD